jgi:signal transduction histidine kinase
MKQKPSFYLFNIAIIVFFVLVCARALLVITAMENAGKSQEMILQASRKILTYADSLNNNRGNISPEAQKHLIQNIRKETNYSLAQNKFMVITNSKSMTFALVSMVALSFIFVLIILRYNFILKKDHNALSKALAEKEVIEKKLAVQNEELSKANHELDNFVHSASHDLRAPLTSIMGLINIMKKEEKDGEKQELLTMMKSSVEKLDFFIRDIIEYSRNSRLSLNIEKVDFNALIQDSISQFQYMEETKHIKFETIISGDVDFYSDRKRISVLLNNFISNGIKYYDQRKESPFICITIKITEAFADIEIRDNGMGISQMYIDKIFNMFYRATQAKSGSGLGLYIVKEVLEKMGGSIQVKSEEKKGTTFSIQIPNSGKENNWESS